VSKRNRLFAAILLAYLLGVGVLLYRVSTDLDARYRESAEESLVDTAHLLAAFIEDDLRAGPLDGSGGSSTRPTPGASRPTSTASPSRGWICGST
jgi:two-component system sensor histidine kinase CreC